MSKSLSKSRFIELFGDPFLIDEKEKVPFKNAIAETVKGPFGSDMKKSLFVPKSDTTYKVFSQVNAIQKDATAGDYYISAEYYEKMKRFTVNSGDYIVTCDGTLGKIYCLPENIEKGVISSSLLRIALNKDVISNVYFETIWNMYMLPMLVRRSRNACLVHLPSAKDIGNLPVPIPNIDKQRDYDKFSNQIDKSKFILQKMIEKLELLKKSRFIELFGDPRLNNKKLPIKKIKDFAKCIAGATPSTAESSYWDNGTIPWMSSGEVNQGRIYSTEKKITQKGYDNASTKLIPPHTVVIAMAGQGKTRGTVGVAEIELCTNQSICSVVTDDTVDVDYLYYFLKLQYEALRGASNGAAGRGGLNLKIIGDFPVIVPDLNLQKSFVKCVNQIDKSKLILQKQLDDLVGETK